jgi:acylphosphatase
MGVKGQVRNMGDGRVEIVAEGDEKLLKQFLSKIEQGPSFGNVSNIETNWSNSFNHFSDFNIAY